MVITLKSVLNGLGLKGSLFFILAADNLPRDPD